MRRAAKIDANQPEIVAALKRVGATVQSLASIGHGCPDLLVHFRGEHLLLECKDGARPPSDRKLTPDQVEWIKRWGGHVHVVLSPDDALRAIGVIE